MLRKISHDLFIGNVEWFEYLNIKFLNVNGNFTIIHHLISNSYSIIIRFLLFDA